MYHNEAQLVYSFWRLRIDMASIRTFESRALHTLRTTF